MSLKYNLDSDYGFASEIVSVTTFLYHLNTYKHTSLQLLTQTCINIRTNAHKICTDTQNKLIK